jgi:hypothetical protein
VPQQFGVKKRVNYSSAFKTKLVLELLQNENTLAEISSKHNILPQDLVNWKKTFLAISIGFIKVNNFRNSNNKIQYSYLLTPKGIEGKAKLTLDFIRIKTQEYDTLKQEIESLKQEAKNMDRNLL